MLLWGIEWGEAKDTAKQPTMHNAQETASSLYRMSQSKMSAVSAEAEKACTAPQDTRRSKRTDPLLWKLSSLIGDNDIYTQDSPRKEVQMSKNNYFE